MTGNRLARLRRLREELGEAAYDAERAAGRKMTLEQAAAVARDFALGAEI